MKKRLIFLVSFLLSFSVGIAAYTNSSFIESFGGKKMVGVLFALGACCGIAVLSQAAVIIGRIGIRNFFLRCAGIQAIAFVLLVTSSVPALQAAAFVGYLASIYALAYSVDVFFEHVMPVGARGKTRGIFLLLGNCAWLAAPLAGIHLKDAFGYRGIYLVALLILAVCAAVIVFGLSKYTDAKYTPDRSRFTFARALKHPRFRAVICANFILQFFYAWMVVYMPIYLHEHLGFSWNSLAFVFTGMLLSFVILDYPLGKIADHFGSEKEFAAIGFVIMIISVLGFFFIPNPTLLEVGILLFVSRVGAATVEAMTEIHFFKIAKDSEPGLLSVFRDLSPLSYLVAPLIGTVIISFMPFRSLFIILAFVLVFGLASALRMEKNSAWWKRSHTA